MLDLLIDLDNTIYSESEKIFSQVDSRMKEFISKKLEVDSKKAYLIQNLPDPSTHRTSEPLMSTLGAGSHSLAGLRADVYTG